MSIILEKEKIITNKAICKKYDRVRVECDIIVPDVNPDILRILDTSGYVSVTEKSIRAGKIYINGCVHITALYAPEGETINKIKALNATAQFSHSFDAGDFDNARLSVDAEAESFDFTIINSRKLNLKCFVGLNAELCVPSEFEIISQCTDPEICMSCEEIRLCNTSVDCERKISVSGQLELPSNLPAIGEILKMTVFPQSTEFLMTDNKAVSKGDVRLCTVYTSKDDGSVKFIENTISFSENLDIEEAEEDMEGEIEYSVFDLYFEAKDDSDGEPRIIGVDLNLNAHIKGFKITDISILTDAYSTKDELKLSRSSSEFEEMTDNSTAQLTHKATIALSEHMPDILQICDISANASIDSITAENGELSVTGKLHTNILYISDDDTIPGAAFSEETEFTHKIPTASADKSTICEGKIFTEHISYTMNNSRSIDIRAVLGLSIRSFKTKTISPVSDIEISENDEKCCKSPCITLYYIKSGDTLWKIAKKYKTTVENIMNCNNLKDDKLEIGQQICIC